MDQPARYPVRPAAALLAAPTPDMSHGELAAALADALGGDARIGERIGGALPKHAPDGSPIALALSPHGAIALLHAPCETALALLRDAAAAGVIDTARSALIVGTEHVVLPGDGALLVTMLTRRRAELSRVAYLDRWLNGHAPFGLRSGAAGYRQLHAGARAAHAGLPEANRYDGIGLVLFRDAAHAAAARAAPAIARDATADEMEFIDHSRSMLAMFALRQ